MDIGRSPAIRLCSVELDLALTSGIDINLPRAAKIVQVELSYFVRSKWSNAELETRPGGSETRVAAARMRDSWFITVKYPSAQARRTKSDGLEHAAFLCDAMCGPGREDGTPNV